MVAGCYRRQQNIMDDFYLNGAVGQAANPIADTSILQGIGHPLREINESTLNTYTLSVTNDSGNGSVEDDVNNTDFTGQGIPSSPTSDKLIQGADVINFVHKNVLYSYAGPRNVSVGIGGSRTTIAADFVPQGTSDHSLLNNLSAADQHPQVAITDLLTDQAAQDQQFIDHITPATTPDPHTQYVLESVALGIFVAVGYGGITAIAGNALPNITGSWQTITGFDNPAVVTSKEVVQDYPNDGIRLSIQGIWRFNVSITLGFNDSNGGRTINSRIFNATTGIGGLLRTAFIGRNQDGGNITLSGIYESFVADVGDLLVVQISTPDNFTGVSLIHGALDVSHISEAQNL